MKFCNKKIQKHLLNGGKIKRRIETREIIIHLAKTGSFFNDKGDVFYISITDLTANDWEIVKPKYDWDKIVKDKILCHFWDNNQETQTPCMGYLEEKAVDGFRRCGDGYATWKNCAPVKIEQFNIAKDLKDYEK